VSSPSKLEELFQHAGKSMFWPFALDQTINTHCQTQLQWLIVLTDSIWIPFHPWILLYHRPQGSWTMDMLKISVSPFRQVNVLAIYTRSNHEYTLSKPTVWLLVLTDWTWIPFHPWIMLYQRP